MTALIVANKPTTAPAEWNTSVITDREQTILEYIGGYLLHRLKDKYSEIVQKLCTANSGLLNSWISVMNRGGLQIPKLELMPFLTSMEMKFRITPIESQSRIDFVSYVRTLRLDITIRSQDDPEVEHPLDAFVTDLAELFYRVRMHQKCCSVMEGIMSSTKKINKKAKALCDTS